MEIQEEDGSWPCDKLFLNLNHESSSDLTMKETKEKNIGRVGLDNLGNTCYLNSSLQALLHTPQLKAYFVDKAYLSDVNISNSFGYGGHLAYAFGKLANELWNTNKKSISPIQFRKEIGKITFLILFLTSYVFFFLYVFLVSFFKDEQES